PTARTGTILPAIGPPSAEVWLARPRDRIEPPDKLARPHIEGARIAAWAYRTGFRRRDANDGEVFINGGRRAHTEAGGGPTIRDAFAQQDIAILRKVLDRLSGHGLKRVQ